MPKKTTTTTRTAPQKHHDQNSRSGWPELSLPHKVPGQILLAGRAAGELPARQAPSGKAGRKDPARLLSEVLRQEESDDSGPGSQPSD